MSWLRTLTPAQRRVLFALAISVIAVTGLLGWSVWSTLQQPQAPSPLATPTRLPATATRPPNADALRTQTLAPSPTPVAAFEISRAGIIASEIAEARQTTNRWGTPLSLVDDTGMARALYAHYQIRPPLVIRARPVLTALRLWFWESLRQDIIRQSEQAAAFYSYELEELYLRRDWTGTQDLLELQLAYGYARALPEQTGNLATLREEAPGDPTTLDRGLALNAVADGDAFIALLLHQDIKPGSAEAEQVRTEIARAVCPEWQTDDPLLDELTCVAFWLGTDFVATLYAEGGIAAMDAVILRPPRSTEQILHPESYTQALSTTLDLEPRLLTPLMPDLSADWSISTTDTLGEVLMGVVLREWSQEVIGAQQATGWDGDLIQVWQAAGGATVTAWQTAWDEPRLAGQFYRHMLDLLPGILVPDPITDIIPPSGIPGGRWWSGDQGAAYLYRYGDEVCLIWSADVDAVMAVAAALR